MFIKKSSFTLSEILITLVIIGILAIAIIPQTFGNIRTEASKVKFRNTYIQMQKSLNAALQSDGVSFLAITKMEHENNNDNARTNVEDFIKKYFGGALVERSDSANSGISVTTGSGMTDYSTIAQTYKLPNGAHFLIPVVTQDIIEDEDGNGCIEPRQNQDTTALCVAYIDINGEKAPNVSLGTILKGSSKGAFSGDDVTGACMAVEGSAYSVVFDLRHFCQVPEGVNFDIYPVILSDNGLRPYSNVVAQMVDGAQSLAAQNDTNTDPNVIQAEVEKLEKTKEEKLDE
ncbi:hypothetical protein J6S88_06725 [bacterium]|nr:hypothetical protein [bacterium]